MMDKESINDFICSRNDLYALAYCREEDILPRLMACMKRKIPADSIGFFAIEKSGESSSIRMDKFSEIYPEQSSQEELRKLIQDLSA